ncbi:MAG: tetratricopeptide repeat protein [Omnitrophica bacterium]|nr:tetratricopeptide repeat protein [Candidatus Omnitrophota bacterium]
MIKARIVFYGLILIGIAVTTTFIYHNTQQADINYYRGHRLFEKGEYDKAIKFFKKSLLINPANQDAVTELAYSYQWTDNYEKAMSNFQRALSFEPDDNKLKVALAKTYSWTKEYQKAIPLYKEVIEITDSIDAKRQLAEVYIWNSQPDKAKDILEVILKDTPLDVNAKLLFAKAMHYSGGAEKAAVIYEELLEKEKSEEKDIEEQKEIKVLLGEAYIISKDYAKAVEKYKEILKEDPGSIEARAGLADVFAYSKEFNKAIFLYKEILEEEEDLEVKRKLADVLSLDKKYDEAIRLYDEILDEKEDTKARLQKARILGWTREYGKSLKEYRKIVEFTDDVQVALEMRAKEAYWNNRVKHAIRYYNELIKKDPENVEAMFDLAQVYSYQSMWKEAKEEYGRILAVSPEHCRAEEGLEKVKFIADHLALKSGYEFFEADSKGRQSDIKRHAFFNKITFPVNYNFKVELDYRHAYRSFSDFGDVVENEGKVELLYKRTPDWWVQLFYDFIAYNKDIDTMHNFGSSFTFRVFDRGEFTTSYQRERLENTSTVIRDAYYKDDYKQRIYFDVNKKIKFGLDFLLSGYSDDKWKYEPGFDLLYYISLEPKRFMVKYRVFFRDFSKTVNEYFSPRDFWTNTLTFNWRHFLNKEEIFFGADDVYYDLTYNLSVDSEDIVSHGFIGEFNWDINKRLNFNIQGAVTNTSVDVYGDKRVSASLKYYF